MPKIPYPTYTPAPKPLSFQDKISLKLDGEFLQAVIAGMRPERWDA